MERGIRFRIEVKQYAKSGRAFWNDIEVQPIHDHLQKLTGFVGFAQDVSHRKRRLQELRESESFLRATLNAIPDAVAILDQQGRIIETNPTWNARALRAGFEPTQYRDYLAAQRELGAGAREDEALQRVLSGLVESLELEFERPGDEESQWEVLRMRRFRAPAGLHTIVAYGDITQRKRNELAHYMARKSLALNHEELKLKQAMLEATNAEL
jgi:PAS domain-containing protein